MLVFKKHNSLTIVDFCARRTSEVPAAKVDLPPVVAGSVPGEQVHSEQKQNTSRSIESFVVHVDLCAQNDDKAPVESGHMSLFSTLSLSLLPEPREPAVYVCLWSLFLLFRPA